MGAKAKPDSDITVGGSLQHSDRKPDFSGWATKFGLKCSDGRTITDGAFAHQDKTQVPLVWHHTHDQPTNVLGHVDLEERPGEGTYCYGYFNPTEQGENAKALVIHEDIKFLSIFANQLKERGQDVIHGIIREVSLVLAGANPGALIDNLELAHSDGNLVTIEDEAVIYTGEPLEHADKPAAPPAKKDDDTEPSIQDVFDAMNDDQKNVVHYFVGAALETKKDDGAAHSGTKSDPPNDDAKEGTTMKRNVFDQTGGTKKDEPVKHELSHDDMRGIAADAVKRGSLKEAVEAYALSHGINNIDILFPDARTITDRPEFDARRMEWVKSVINGTRHSPFSRIKSIVADITHDEARAKGYIKGNFKKEEWFGLVKRVTTPSTIYKKQKLDRDDIIDITDFDVVMWLKGEMRLMLDEEIARAILLGDGREVDDEDKIKDPAGANEGAGIRAIVNDHDLYAATVTMDPDLTSMQIMDTILANMSYYKGSGAPTFYTTIPLLTKLLLTRDTTNRRLYRTASDVASELGVKEIVTVEVMEAHEDLIGVIVNLTDYTVGTDRGGEISMFDDFDIDYNQYKYLIETRLSGALTKIRSALVLRFADAADTLVEPDSPTFDEATGNITIVDETGVVFHRADTNAVVTAAGSPYNVPDGESLKIYAVPADGYYFENNVDDEWTFTNPA